MAMNNNSVKLNHYLHSSQSHPVLRDWQSRGTTNFCANDFVLPLFIINSDDESVVIESLPNNKRMGVNVCVDYLRPLIEDLNLKSVLLFPVIEDKQIAYAIDSQRNPVLRLIPKLKKEFPQLLILVDVCLCTFSPEGHCCVFDKSGRMDNTSSVEKIASIATKYAEVGADVITPSDMMDTRISFIRNALNYNGFDNVSILAYSAKFDSCFYGPFRDAAGSAPKFGDRKCYQLPTGSRGLALRAVERDIEEGCDMVMVKPGLPYLDIVNTIANRHPNYPIAVYHVSGEYATIVHAANHGVFKLRPAVTEVMTSFKRAGANIIITYFTPLLLEWIKESQHKDN